MATAATLGAAWKEETAAPPQSFSPASAFAQG
jgi:hypothetical protein